MVLDARPRAGQVLPPSPGASGAEPRTVSALRHGGRADRGTPHDVAGFQAPTARRTMIWSDGPLATAAPRGHSGRAARVLLPPSPARPRSRRHSVGVTEFWSRVDLTGPCWVWQGPRSGRMAYGCFYVARRRVWAHRYSWELAHGTVPAGLSVLHHCDNPPCVRPAHLWVGTAMDNAHDRDRKGRQRSGLVGWYQKRLAANAD
jgi:hypothetical protein